MKKQNSDILSNDPLTEKFSENAVTVLKKRYLAKDEKGEIIETVTGLFKRVAENISSADLNYGKSEQDAKTTANIFFEEMSSLRFLPNSPTLMNAGRPLQQLSACFVLPIEDSMESIFETIKNTALIHQSGGGTGFSFSSLRPKNDTVHSTKGVSSGPVSFMQVFNSATEAIKQGGTRRGANMGILRIDHPDIIDFITSKKDTSKLNNFNISVAITEDFMNHALKNEDYPLKNPRNNEITKYLNAKEVFDLIVETAWSSGEPGIVFIDRINKLNPVPNAGKIEATNPCGEQPLVAYESCNLGSINIGKFVKENKIKQDAANLAEYLKKLESNPDDIIDGYLSYIDFDKLKQTVHTAVHFLDNVIEKNRYPLEKIKEMTLSNRKIGLGIMGYADTLIKLGVPYDSELALKIAENIMGFIDKESKVKSEELGTERGSFPNFKGSLWEEKGYKAMRNGTTTTIAPTGTISMIGGASSGIEPLFALAYERRVLDKQRLIETDKNLKTVLESMGAYSDKLIDYIAKNGSLGKTYKKDIADLLTEKEYEYLSRIFITSHDITPKWHVMTQAAFQKFTDNAVSKTVNFPNYAKKEDIEEVYTLAFNLNLKGITVYRDGSREQVLTAGSSGSSHEKETKETSDQKSGGQIEPRKRPDIIRGVTVKTVTGCGPMYVTINYDENGNPFEIFNSIGKSGGCAQSQTESTGRMVSLALRSGIGAEEIINQLKGIRCNIPYGFGGNIIYSCADAIGKALEKSLKEKITSCENLSSDAKKPLIESSANPVGTHSKNHTVQGRGACPSCGGSNLKHAEGCTVCLDCGYSDCG
ncbi:MAG: vitamin B12-dependent ribonucleotide reductase [Candidatus Acidulodesulfobacterium acidiphilum]|uniref:Vitamin B12-dependent ribonucleotide reductase n=1 Tax=Candidatus Acidulodesulfobacterium acidiphilum TaxID=2597224 RepID=A0A520XAT1_9DELT|nr:MAG: vitamin B12-dependent ribonucleotide reductase [Candidatus Acidulodesulfobacterium acidiphilum]